MSDYSNTVPLLDFIQAKLATVTIDITNGLDLGTTGIHASRFSVPAQSTWQPYAIYVQDAPLVGTGASIAIGTDNVATDPDNIYDTAAITNLDAANDCPTPAFGTVIVNNTDDELPIYYNITDAALTAGILKFTGLIFPLL